MTSAYYSTVLDHPLETVWSLIRDFNNYPAYIEGVSESVIEHDRRGDEVGAIRRFCYLGNWVRQRLAVHSDDAHLLSYAGIEPLPFPSAGTLEAVSPAAYEGTMQLTRIVDGNRTFIEWSVALDSEPQDAERWQQLFHPGFRTGPVRSSENTNRLLRQYFPKGLDLAAHSQAELNKVARQLNERPRKTLDFQSPAERFSQCVAATG